MAARVLARAAGIAAASAEVVTFDEREVPAGFTLEATNLVYAFSEKDGPSEVLFEELRVAGTVGDAPKGYYSVSVCVLPWESFSALVTPDDLCEPVDRNGWSRLSLSPGADAGARERAVTLEVPIGSVVSKAVTLKGAGVYAVAVANCGPLEHLALSGRVLVKNAHGYLGGNDARRVAASAWLTVLNLAVLAAWVCLLWCRSSFRYAVLFGFVVAAAISAGSSGMWTLALMEENNTGEAFFKTRLAEALSGLKVLYAAALLLSTASGLGVTERELDTCEQSKIFVVSGLCGFAVIPASSILAQRQAHFFPGGTAVVAALPLVGAGLTVAIAALRALARSIRRCKELGQADSFSRYRRMVVLVVLASLSSAAVLLAQVLGDGEAGRSSQHLVLNDVAPSANFCLWLAGLMYLWAPGPGGFLADAYDEQVDQAEQDVEGAGLKDLRVDVAAPEEPERYRDDHDILADDGPEDEEEEEEERRRAPAPGATVVGAALPGAE